MAFTAPVIGLMLLAATAGLVPEPVEAPQSHSLQPLNSCSMAGVGGGGKESAFWGIPPAPAPSHHDQPTPNGLAVSCSIPVTFESLGPATEDISATAAGSFDFDRYRRGPPSPSPF